MGNRLLDLPLPILNGLVTKLLFDKGGLSVVGLKVRMSLVDSTLSRVEPRELKLG